MKTNYKQKLTRSISGLCISLTFLISLTPFELAYAQESRTLKNIKLGAIVSLTGDAAKNGQNWLDGAQLAIDELNQSGKQVELIVEDDATQPNKVATAFVKLATVDKVSGIVGGTWDFLAETAYPLAQQYQVPFITPSNPVEVLSPSAKINPWVFTNGLSLAAEKTAIIKFLKSSNAKKVALVYINVPYGTIHAELVAQISQELGLDLVSKSEITYSGFSDSIKLAALKLSKSKPELVFVVLNYEGVDLLLKNFEQTSISPIVLMTHTLKEASGFGRSPKRYARSFGIYPDFASEEFENAFENKYGFHAYDQAAAGYDAIKFLAQLAITGHNKKLAAATLNYYGVLGRYNLPCPGRDVVQFEAVILGLKNGELAPYEF